MIKTGLFDKDHLSVLKKAIDVYSGRHQVTGRNISNVDIDNEMTNLATNDLSYRMATRLLSMRYSMLRGAIKGQIR